MIFGVRQNLLQISSWCGTYLVRNNDHGYQHAIIMDRQGTGKDYVGDTVDDLIGVEPNQVMHSILPLKALRLRGRWELTRPSLLSVQDAKMVILWGPGGQSHNLCAFGGLGF